MVGLHELTTPSGPIAYTITSAECERERLGTCEQQMTLNKRLVLGSHMRLKRHLCHS